MYKVTEKLPNQKDLVLVEVEVDGNLIVIPSIYYKSLGGFYHFSLFYHTYEKNVYSKPRCKPKWEIKNVIKWCLIPKSL